MHVSFREALSASVISELPSREAYCLVSGFLADISQMGGAMVRFRQFFRVSAQGSAQVSVSRAVEG